MKPPLPSPPPGGGPRRVARGPGPVALTLVLALAPIAGGAFAQPEQVSAQGPESSLGVIQDLGAPAGQPLSGAELERATHELASRLRCPVCQGLSVADSTSISALSMRDEIQDLFARGYTESQIVEHFESAYGEFVRLVPRARGFNLLVWLLPVVGLLVGLAIVLRQTRGVVTADAGAPAVAAPGDELADYRDRVRRETAGDRAP